MARRLLNQGVDQVVAILRGMEKFSVAKKESLHCAVAEIEEVRATINADLTEQIGDANVPTRLASGSSVVRLKRGGETPTTCISTSRTARKSVRSKDCRRVSALSRTP
jgi:hypothetical protein